MRILNFIHRLALASALSLGFNSNLGAGTADLPIYTDEMANGFEVWGWAPHTLTNPAPVHAGSRSIGVSATAWSGLYIHHADLNTGGYTNLSLWVHGGESGGQLLRISGKLGTNDQSGYSLPPLPAQKWQQFIIPLELLGAENKTNFAGFLLLLQGDCPTTTFYLDDLLLVAKLSPTEARVIVNESQTPPTITTNRSALEQPQTAPPAGAGKPQAGFILLITVGLAVIASLLVWLILVVKRNSFGTRDLMTASSVALVPRPNVPAATVEPAANEDWRQRALAAEAVASKTTQILRDKLMPEMAAFAKSTLVQGLASERNGLLETQRRAQQELTELEARLAELRLPLRERILVYERRIAELEKDLSTRSEEMRELIRATLSLVRQRLEDEKKKELVGNALARS